MLQPTASDPEALFRLLADESRLRIIRALMDCPLTVTELTEVLAMPQSTVSRHLGALRRGELVRDRRDGTHIWYSLSDALVHDGPLVQVIGSTFGRLAHQQADRGRLAAAIEARRARTRDFFDALAGHYHNLARPGGGPDGLVAAMMMALPACTALDLGCGEGDIALGLARLGHQVIAVDSAPAMVRMVAERAQHEGLGNLTVRTGDLEALPLAAASGDLVILSQVLHHTGRPEVALREAARVCRPGGRLVVVDLLRHEQEWVRDKLGDLWLGFDLRLLCRWMAEAGLGHVVAQTVHVEDGLPIIAAGGTRSRD